MQMSMLLYRISCDTGVTFQPYDIVALDNYTEIIITGLYTEMSDTASLTT